MSLRAEISNTQQKIVLDVRIAGARVANVFGADVSLGLSQVNARAGIHLTARPSGADEGAPVEVWAGYNGLSAQLFAGELSGLAWEFWPGVVTLDARDLLARVRLRWGGADRTYNAIDDADFIRNMLEAMGIPSTRAHIESSGWTLAVAQDIVLPKGRPFWSAIAEADEGAGYKTFTRSDGTIWRLRVTRSASGGSVWTYTEGVNIISSRRNRSIDGVINLVEVVGLTYEDVECTAEAKADNPYVPDPPRYISDPYQSDYIETLIKAQEVADRRLADYNKRPETVELEVIGNPLLQPNQTLHIVHPQLELGAANLVIDTLSHSIRANSYRTSIRTLGGNLGEDTPNVPPAIAFDVKLFLEGEDTGAGVARKVVGAVDASATTDPDGDETLIVFAWTFGVDVGTVTPAAVGGAVVRLLIDGAATLLAVTLVATDSGGAASTVTRAVPIEAATLYVEDLYTAEGGVVAGSFDGEQTWVEQATPSGDATCLAAIAPAWGQVWGASSGHVYATFDSLVTLADLGAPHGAIACTAVWVSEDDATRLWAGFADGRVYFGEVDLLAFSATWLLAGRVPVGPINELRESYGTLGELRATAGQGYYYSTDSGAHWVAAHTFVGTAWRMAAGFGENLVGALDDDTPLYGETASPTVPAGVRHLRGLSFGWRASELYAADNLAQLYRSDAGLAALAVVATAPVGINQIIRSGNVDGVVYLAGGDGTGTNNGALKSIRMAAPWYIRKTTARKVHMIGYGAAHLPPVEATLLMPPWGAAGARDKIWRYTRSAGWAGLTPPKAGWFWYTLKRSIFNDRAWLLFGNSYPENFVNRFAFGGGRMLAYDGSASPLWLTLDAGATWAEVNLNTTKTRVDGALTVAWSDTAAGVWFAAAQLDTVSDEQVTFWRGAGYATNASAIYLSASGNYQDTFGLCGGAAGEAVITCTPGHGDPQNFGYVAAAGTSYVAVGGDIDVALDRLEALPGRAVAARSGGNVYVTADYRAAPPALALNQPGGALAAVGSDLLTNAAWGVMRISSPLGTATAAVEPGTAGVNTGAVRAGRRLRTTAAARVLTSTDVLVYNGVSWTTAAGPSGPSAAELADEIEVID